MTKSTRIFVECLRSFNSIYISAWAIDLGGLDLETVFGRWVLDVGGLER